MKTNYTLKEILAEMEQEEKTTFGNLEERVRAKYPHYDDNQVVYEMKRLARTQILHIIGSTYAENDQYRMLKEYFSQKIGGEYLRLPINRKYQANYQNSKALRRLHKEGFLKMMRSTASFHLRLKTHGWKPYGVHQTYLVFNEQKGLHHDVFSV